MEPLTFDDVLLHWDPSAVHDAFRMANSRATSLHTLGENLTTVERSALEKWSGEAGHAFNVDLGKARDTAASHALESRRVAVAVVHAEERITRAQAEAKRLQSWATANHWTITPDWKVDIGNTGAGRGRDLQFITACQELQTDLDKLHTEATRIDHDLASAVQGAVDDGEAAPGADPGGGASPAGDYVPVTAEQLRRIVPELSQTRADEIVGPLNQAMQDGGMNTPQRQAAFISQVAVESDRFNTFEEYADGSQYEGRVDLGNTQPGDGTKYKGRGAIQVTGRGNYTQMSEDLGVDFVNNPQLAASPEYAFKSAEWYWSTHGGNTVADTGNITKITEMVNGGDHGLAERTTYFNNALQVLAR